MTLTNLRDELYRRLNFATSPDTTVTTRLTAYLNEGLQELASVPGLQAALARASSTTVTTVSGTAQYTITTLPRIDAVLDTANAMRLAMRDKDWYFSAIPDPSALTGLPEAWVPINTTAAGQVIAFYPTPASALTYTIQGDAEFSALSSGSDTPTFPARFHRILVDFALWKEWEKQDDTRARAAEARWLKGVSDLKYFVTCPPDFLPVSGQGRPLDHSRFGAWYPAWRG